MDEFRWGRVGMRVGQFTLRSGIATGGFGEVWLAEADLVADSRPGDGSTPRTKLRRAVKLLMDDVTEEATKASAVLHPNVVQIYSCAKIPSQPLWWVAMEFVDGYTLEQLRRWLPAQTPPPRPALLDVALGLTAGLAAVHEATDNEGRRLRLIHRDIKPSNVMVNMLGEVKILDFGIAKDLSSHITTLPNERRFTPRYAAPEQHLGEKPSVGTDLYSFATVIFEFTCGEPLFTASSDTEYERLKVGHAGQERVRERRAQLGELTDILLPCLERDPRSRPASARDIHEALARLRAALPARPRLEHLVRLRREGLLPPDITGPLPSEWGRLVQHALQPPLPQPLDPGLLHGEPYDPRAAPPFPEGRADSSGLVWPTGHTETWQPGARGAPDGQMEERPPSSPIATDPAVPDSLPNDPQPAEGPPDVKARREPTVVVDPEPPTPDTSGTSGAGDARGEIKEPWLRRQGLLLLLLLLALVVAVTIAAIASTLLSYLQDPGDGRDTLAPVPPVVQQQQPPPSTCADADEDGYKACEPQQADHDCNDGDREVHPGAEERCNGRDDDCDGQPGTDEVEGASGQLRCATATVTQQTVQPATPRGSVNPVSTSPSRTSASRPTYTCYVDNDGDGYGASETRASTSSTCSEAGLAAKTGDCDDYSGRTYPGAYEDCTDKVNSDCSVQDTCATYEATLRVSEAVGFTRPKLGIKLSLRPSTTCDSMLFQVKSSEAGSEWRSAALRRGLGGVWEGEIALTGAESKPGSKLTYKASCTEGGTTDNLPLGDGFASRTYTIR